MTYSTFTHGEHHMPARSIPNLQNGIETPHHIAHEYLTRSSSQPAEIWHRSNPHIKSVSDLFGWAFALKFTSEKLIKTISLHSASNQSFSHAATHKSTQTDSSFDYEFLENLGKKSVVRKQFLLGWFESLVACKLFNERFKTFSQSSLSIFCTLTKLSKASSKNDNDKVVQLI